MDSNVVVYIHRAHLILFSSVNKVEDELLCLFVVVAGAELEWSGKGWKSFSTRFPDLQKQNEIFVTW